MNNRTLFSLTAIVILSMLVLLGMNMTSILTGQPKDQTYLKYNQVRGMAVSYHNLLYTLNFQQQNQIIEILNQSVRIFGFKTDKHQKPDIEKIIVYQFNNQPDLVIYPVAYTNQNLVFSVPEWQSEGYLMELSKGTLQHLLSQTYDP